MSLINQIPRQGLQFLDEDGYPTKVWYNFLFNLTNASVGNTEGTGLVVFNGLTFITRGVVANSNKITITNPSGIDDDIGIDVNQANLVINGSQLTGTIGAAQIPALTGFVLKDSGSSVTTFNPASDPTFNNLYVNRTSTRVEKQFGPLSGAGVVVLSAASAQNQVLDAQFLTTGTVVYRLPPPNQLPIGGVFNFYNCADLYAADIATSSGTILHHLGPGGSVQVKVQDTVGAATKQWEITSSAPEGVNWENSQLNLPNTMTLIVNGTATINSLILAAPLATTYGGTGQISYTNGQVLIGNGSGSLTKSTLTAGTGISITNGSGSITIAATATSTSIARTFLLMGG